MEGPSNQPFRERLQKHRIAPVERAEKLQQIGEDARNVVRIIRPENREMRTSLIDKEASLPEIAAKAQHAFRELEETTGIRAPVNFIVGSDSQGREVLYGVSPRVISAGFNLNDEEKSEQRREYVALLNKLFTYLATKHEHFSPYPYDIYGDWQYVYGKTEEGSKNQWYLVDVDPYISEVKTGPRKSIEVIARHLSKFKDVLESRILKEQVEQYLATHPEHTTW